MIMEESQFICDVFHLNNEKNPEKYIFPEF